MAANLNDLIKAVTATPIGMTNMQDGMRDYFGASAEGISLNLAIIKSLRGRGATSTIASTCWLQYFNLSWPDLVGTIQDKQKEFWKQGGFAAEPPPP